MGVCQGILSEFNEVPLVTLVYGLATHIDPPYFLAGVLRNLHPLHLLSSYCPRLSIAGVLPAPHLIGHRLESSQAFASRRMSPRLILTRSAFPPIEPEANITRTRPRD